MKNKKNECDIRFRMSASVHQQMLSDLRRPHAFASERVGFLYTSSTTLKNGVVIIIAKEYVAVADDDYEEDHSVGAKINANAIRKGMQTLFEKQGGCFHVHLHDYMGETSPGYTDTKSLPAIAKSFSNISGEQATGFLILSSDSFYASVHLKDHANMISPTCISCVGYPMNLRFPSAKISYKGTHHDRQSFLGSIAPLLFDNIRVAIVGYGGGGSHIGQQLSHLKVKHIRVYDGDHIEESNLNRLIGAWFTDLKKSLLKTNIARRVIKKIQPNAVVHAISRKWQEEPEWLQSADIAFGNVDSYLERDQLEAECRRWLIPLIDIGMDVNENDDHKFSMSGQVILSMPEMPCLHCFKYLTPEKLAKEAANYGAVGGRPQVVWPNGVLASTAIGMFVNLVTGWKRQNEQSAYLAYDGNNSTVTEHIREKYAPPHCVHYPLENVGKPIFKKL
jgi:molybdopterin/thiamine biosynthesis adenylyltransferase